MRRDAVDPALSDERDRHQDGNVLVRRRRPSEEKTAKIAVDENLKALVAADDQRIGRPQRRGQGHLVCCHAWIQPSGRVRRAGTCGIDREWLVAASSRRVDLGHRIYQSGDRPGSRAAHFYNPLILIREFGSVCAGCRIPGAVCDADFRRPSQVEASYALLHQYADQED